MQDFAGKVAVVTGAASGIGLALTRCFAAAGMRVVMADVEAPALEEAAHAVSSTGAPTLAVRTDVATLADVEALAARTVAAFGAVHVVCNNAGVAISGTTWLHTIADWEWVLGVNLWGVIHGVRVFLPLLLAQGGEGHIVNTASMAGVVSAPGMAIYNVSKHGVVALSETLHHELRQAGSAVRVSVLCPSFTRTRILDSARNRPAALAEGSAAPRPLAAAGRDMLAAGQPPEEVADAVLDAIRRERFYVFPYPGWQTRVRTRMEDMLAERTPTPLRPQDFPAGGPQ
jgi:NAD(P)-dependent dehydrogenase (short-subunit alcohol dehydrogenase family)